MIFMNMEHLSPLRFYDLFDHRFKEILTSFFLKHCVLMNHSFSANEEWKSLERKRRREEEVAMKRRCSLLVLCLLQDRNQMNAKNHPKAVRFQNKMLTCERKERGQTK